MDIFDIRTKLAAGQFEFSRHAFKRVVERNITETEIRAAGSNAELIEDYPDDKYSPSCLVLGFTDDRRPLHLQVCYRSPQTVKIITVYEPDPMTWVDLRTRNRP